MDVRCVRCGTEYELDAAQVGPDGRRVRCTACGHVFTVEPPGGAARPWRVRRSNGDVYALRELTTLQQWIVERKVGRDDEIGYVGRGWKRLGDIAELAAFFAVVDEAERAEAEGREAAAVAPRGELQLDIEVVPPAEPEPGAPAEAASGPAAAPAADGGWGAMAPGRAAVAAAPAPRRAPPPTRAAAEPAWVAEDAPAEPEAAPTGPEDISPAAEFQRSARRAPPAKRGRGLKVTLWALFLLVAGATAVVALYPGEVLDLLGRVAPQYFSTEPARPAPTPPAAGEQAAEPTGVEAGATEPTGVEPGAAVAAEAGAPAPAAEAPAGGEAEAASPEAAPSPAPAAEEPDAEEPAAEEPGAGEAEAVPPAGSDADETAAAPAAPQGNGAAPAPTPPRALSFDQLLARADRLRRVGQVEAALDLYGRARDRQPDRPEPYAGQGWSYMELRAWEPAVAAFEEALERQPRYGEALIGLAESHRFAGRKEAAREAYRRYLELLPDGPDAELARTALESL